MKEVSRLHSIPLRTRDTWISSLHYVMPKAVSDMLGASFMSWREISSLELPHCRTIVEFTDADHSVVVFLFNGVQDMLDLAIYTVSSTEVAEVFNDGVLFFDRDDEGRLQKAYFNIKGRDANAEKDLCESVDDVLRRFFSLLNTRGVAQERVEAPAKLNKKRLAHGKPAIQPYIRLVVGQVYDREGNEVPEHARRHVRPHIRAGYSRRQHHGPRNELIKIVHLPPTVVNYGAGEILPDRPRVFALSKSAREANAADPSVA